MNRIGREGVYPLECRLNNKRRKIEMEDFKMKKKITLLIVLACIMIMAVQTAMASNYSDGSIGLPGGTVTAHNEVYNNLKNAYAKTNGPTNAYISVSIKGYYVNTVTNLVDETPEISGSISGVYIRKDAPTRGSNEQYYKIKSTHAGSIGDDSGSVTLVTIP